MATSFRRPDAPRSLSVENSVGAQLSFVGWRLPNLRLQLPPRFRRPTSVTGRRTACGVAAGTVTATARGAPSAPAPAAPVPGATETRFVRLHEEAASEIMENSRMTQDYTYYFTSV